MYTDDYQSYEAYASLVALSAPQTAVYRISEGKGARDVYGFNAGMKTEIGLALVDIVRKIQSGAIASATIYLDDNRRMVFHQWYQAANFYERLTGCELLSGMAGSPKKLTSKKNVGARWQDTPGSVGNSPVVHH
jgi:hypothetical protein